MTVSLNIEKDLASITLDNPVKPQRLSMTALSKR
jgi:hypothetical protein